MIAIASRAAILRGLIGAIAGATCESDSRNIALLDAKKSASWSNPASRRSALLPPLDVPAHQPRALR
jgi:hypothetical protein